MSFFSALLAEGIQSGAAALIGRGSFTPEEIVIINDTFVKLQADDQLQHLYSAKVYGVSSEANSFLDWINATGAYDASKVGTPTFTQYHGWSGTGSTSDYIDSGFNPSSVVPLNSFTYQGWELSDATDGSQLFGCQNGATDGIICIPKLTTNAITRGHSSGNDTVAQTGRPVGFWTLERNSSANYVVRIQYVTKTTHIKTSTAIPNLNIWHLCGNNNGVPGTAGAREIGAFVVSNGTGGNYNLIADAFNDAVVRLHGLSL